MNNQDQDQERAFLAAIRKRLNHSADSLDDRLVSRLQAARREALTGAGRGWWLSWPRTAAVATVLAMAVLTVFLYLKPAHLSGPAGFEDVDILAAGDSLDFYLELDFYTWLAEEGNHAG